MVFEDSSGQDQECIEDVSNIRDAYCARMQNHMAALRDVCAHYGWHYILHSTDMPLVDTLRGLWDMIDHG